MSQIFPERTIDDRCELAALWGMEDALEGNWPCAVAYFALDSPTYDAYYAGYAEGVAIRLQLTGIATPGSVGPDEFTLADLADFHDVVQEEFPNDHI